jgi:ATP-binding cassette, subfamily B, bacterial
VIERLHQRNEWKFFSVLPRADPGLALTWWSAVLLRGLLPAVFAIAMGILVSAVHGGGPLAGPLTFVGAVFVLLQVLAPVHERASAKKPSVPRGRGCGLLRKSQLQFV